MATKLEIKFRKFRRRHTKLFKTKPQEDQRHLTELHNRLESISSAYTARRTEKTWNQSTSRATSQSHRFNKPLDLGRVHWGSKETPEIPPGKYSTQTTDKPKASTPLELDPLHSLPEQSVSSDRAVEHTEEPSSVRTNPSQDLLKPRAVERIEDSSIVRTNPYQDSFEPPKSTPKALRTPSSDSDHSSGIIVSPRPLITIREQGPKLDDLEVPRLSHELFTPGGGDTIREHGPKLDGLEVPRLPHELFTPGEDSVPRDFDDFVQRESFDSSSTVVRPLKSPPDRYSFFPRFILSEAVSPSQNGSVYEDAREIFSPRVISPSLRSPSLRSPSITAMIPEEE